MASRREGARDAPAWAEARLRETLTSGKRWVSGGPVKRSHKVVLGLLVAVLLAIVAWWQGAQLTPEQRAEADAANAILEQDEGADEALGDLSEDMKGLGMDSDDEAEADQILDDLLGE